MAAATQLLAGTVSIAIVIAGQVEIAPSLITGDVEIGLSPTIAGPVVPPSGGLPTPRTAGDLLVAVTGAAFEAARPLVNASSAQILFNNSAEMVTT